MNGKKTIGILGGMGPLATADLFEKITLLTKAETDRDHIRVYIDSNTNIPDRTAAILNGGADPVPEMADALKHLELPFLSILTAAAEACARQFPGRTVGILATRGTLAAGLYQQALAVQGVEYLVPDEAEQDALMRVIYDGVKAGRGPEVYGPVFRTVTEGMAARGAEVFLLGCTELPMAAAGAGLTAPTVDPTAELAKAAIRFCGFSVRTDKD